MLQDLLKCSSNSPQDEEALRDALSLTQAFLDSFNMIETKKMFGHEDRAQRRLVKVSQVLGKSTVSTTTTTTTPRGMCYRIRSWLSCVKDTANFVTCFSSMMLWRVLSTRLQAETSSRSSSSGNVVYLPSPRQPSPLSLRW